MQYSLVRRKRRLKLTRYKSSRDCFCPAILFTSDAVTTYFCCRRHTVQFRVVGESASQIEHKQFSLRWARRWLPTWLSQCLCPCTRPPASTCVSGMSVRARCKFDDTAHATVQLNDITGVVGNIVISGAITVAWRLIFICKGSQPGLRPP